MADLADPLRRRAIGAGLALTAAAGIPACGGGDDLPDDGGVPNRGVVAVAPRGVEPSRLNISVTELGSARARYVAPRSIRGGVVEIRLANRGKAQHKAQLWRIGPGHTVAEALALRQRRRPRWLEAAGGVGVTRPGFTGSAVQSLPPGRYYVGGAGSQRTRVAPVRVTEGPTGVRPPGATAVITAVDHDFRFSGLRAGRTNVEFRNTGKEPHHALFAPMRPEADLADVRRFLRTGGSSGPPPVDYSTARETVILDGGQRQVTQLDLRPRRYAVLCFVRDRDGGPTHVEKGMVAEFEAR